MLSRLFALLATLVALSLLLIALANAWVVLQAGEPVQDLQKLESTPVALVLGTSHWSSEGRPNRHFAGRMDAAADLYHAGLVRHLLASGANPEIYYNEPQRMFEALTERGVPASSITLDYAGRRTLDSVVRAGRIFGQTRIIIVSQEYHLYRALYLARHHGLQAQGYAAPGPGLGQRWRMEMREVLARLLAVLDTQILQTQAQVLGTPEPIEITP